MNKFQQAYEAAQDALKLPLSGDLKSYRSDLRALLAAGGPASAKRESLNMLRNRIELGAVTHAKSSGKGKTKGEALYICASAGGSGGKAKRAATLKMLRHLYHGQSAGAAAIWIYSPPAAFDKWIFDKLAQDDDGDIAANLGVDPKEVYSVSQRKVMVEAISEAKRIAINAALKVETPNAAAKKLLRQYFTDTANADLTDICDTLAPSSANRSMSPSACPVAGQGARAVRVPRRGLT